MESGSDAHVLTDPVNSAACPKCGALLDVTGLPAFTAVQCPTCECEFQTPARFGSFLLLQLLGAGGMGGVYRARDESLNREVAIKVMLKSLGDDPHFVETFQREAQAAARLNNPHIAQIYSFGQEHGQPYIVMELVSNGSMDKMMATQGPLDPAAVIHVGAQIAEGLREAADSGLVHGDVKPENILFDNDKNAKLVDFGLAALNGGPGADVWGTPFYIAPEKVRRQKSDFRADIYSLGATLYHAIAGVPPFDGADATAVVKARFDGPPKSLKELRGNAIPPEVDALILRMLAVEPQMRYPTYGSLLGDMRSYLAKAGPVQLPLGGNTKKIMFKGKLPKGATQKNATGVMLTTGTVGEIPPGMTPVDQIPVEETAAKKGFSKQQLKIVAMAAGGVVLLSLVLGGGIWGCSRYSANKKVQEELAQVERNQAKARASISKSVANVKTIAERLRALVTEAMEYAKDGADAAVAVLGEGARSSLVPPEPDYAAAPAVAEAVAPAAPAAPEKGASVAKGKGEKTAPAKDGADKGKETAKAAGEKEVAKTPAKEPAANPAQASVSGEPVAAAAEGEPSNPCVAAVRGMYEGAYAVKKVSLLADACLTDLEAQAKTAEKMTDPQQLQGLIRLANGLVDKSSELSHMRDVAGASYNVSQIKKALTSLRKDLGDLAEKKRLEDDEKKKQEQETALAEKKQKELEAHKAKIQSECDRVASTQEQVITPLKQLQFRDALRVLKDLTDSLETKEGLDALNLATERVNRVKEFHQYLVEKVQGYKSSRGWTIENADQKTLTVGGKKIQWVEVYSSRLDIVAELVRGLVSDEQVTKNMKLSEKTKLMTNAALCLNLFYKDMQSAQDFAKQLATSAAQQFEAGSDIIKKLLPDFFKE